MNNHAIVLKTTPFRDYHQIVSLFTKERGVVSAVANYSLGKKSPLFGCFIPLNEVEVTFSSPSKDLEKVERAALMSSHPALRQDYDVLQAACKLLDAVTASQLGGKEAPLLYDLLKHFLTFLPEAICPTSMVTSFQIKTLLHEGVLSLKENCDSCGEHLQEAYVSEGVFYCKKDTPFPHVPIFSRHELDLFLALGLTTSKKLLLQLEAGSAFQKKVEEIFHALS